MYTSVLFVSYVSYCSIALEALQVALESMLTEMFELANLACIHAKRVTVKPADLHLVRRFQSQLTGVVKEKN
jgi:histone H3/H4